MIRSPEAWVELHPDYLRERWNELMSLKGVWYLIVTETLKAGPIVPMVKKEIDLCSSRVRTTFEDGSTAIEIFLPDLSPGHAPDISDSDRRQDDPERLGEEHKAI